MSGLTPPQQQQAQNQVPVEVPRCPSQALPHFHTEDSCFKKPSHLPQGSLERNQIYQRLKHGGTGATLVPNQQTIVCPLEHVPTLEDPSAHKGFDTTWIVENTSTHPVVIAWMVDGVEWSPFTPDVRPMDDPKAILAPGDWTSVPTFESFVYHVRQIEENGTAGSIVLQHRAGLVPLGNPRQAPCDGRTPDVEPVHPKTAERKSDFARTPTHEKRRCNTIGRLRNWVLHQERIFFRLPILTHNTSLNPFRNSFPRYWLSQPSRMPTARLLGQPFDRHSRIWLCLWREIQDASWNETRHTRFHV